MRFESVFHLEKNIKFIFQSRIVSSTRVWKGDDRLGFSDMQCLIAHLLVQVAQGI